MRHVNLPIFIPHLGCPNDCVFCNQRKISGKTDFDITKVRADIDEYLSTLPSECSVQLAFFGGSFTGIDRADMLYLLDIAKEYTDRGLISSVRVSTRPDYIDREILDILKAHSVKSIELGIQSMSDKVLKTCKRGHDRTASTKACRLIKEYGFELVGQMMTALPGSTLEDELDTARVLAALEIDGARIYPTMVFDQTELGEMLADGSYTPPSLDELVYQTKEVFSVFRKKNIPVIRIGLQVNEGLENGESLLGGSYHPSMGELVISEYYYDLIKKQLSEYQTATDSVTVYCAPGEVSKIIGQKRKNKERLYEEFGIKSVKVLEKSDIMMYNVLIKYN